MGVGMGRVDGRQVSLELGVSALGDMLAPRELVVVVVTVTVTAGDRLGWSLVVPRSVTSILDATARGQISVGCSRRSWGHSRSSRGDLLAVADRCVVTANALEAPVTNNKVSFIQPAMSSRNSGKMTYLVKSNPPSSSSGITGGESTVERAATMVGAAVDLVGLGTGDLPRGGLLLGGGRPGPVPMGLDGLASKEVCTGLSGVLPMSAYFQNGAGELVGMCWLGRWAVLGGASLGWTRWGAGVTKEELSSGR